MGRRQSRRLRLCKDYDKVGRSRGLGSSQQADDSQPGTHTTSQCHSDHSASTDGSIGFLDCFWPGFSIDPPKLDRFVGRNNDNLRYNGNIHQDRTQKTLIFPLFLEPAKSHINPVFNSFIPAPMLPSNSSFPAIKASMPLSLPFTTSTKSLSAILIPIVGEG